MWELCGRFRFSGCWPLCAKNCATNLFDQRRSASQITTTTKPSPRTATHNSLCSRNFFGLCVRRISIQYWVRNRRQRSENIQKMPHVCTQIPLSDNLQRDTRLPSSKSNSTLARSRFLVEDSMQFLAASPQLDPDPCVEMNGPKYPCVLGLAPRPPVRTLMMACFHF